MTSANKTETYIGLTATEFKARFRNHQVSFNKKRARTTWNLASTSGSLKATNINKQTGIIKPETIRYSRLSVTPDDYNFIHKLFSLRLIALDYPDKLISEHSFPWLTLTAHRRRHKDQQTDKQKLTVYYKTLYNKDKQTDKIVTNILHKYRTPNIPNLTKTNCNSTKLHIILLYQ